MMALTGLLADSDLLSFFGMSSLSDVFSFLQYDFMRNALIGILLISPLFGLAGTLVINNQLSYYSDALGHSVLAGVAIGTLIGFQDPLFAMMVFSILFGLGIATVRHRARASTDTIIGIFSATAIALGIALLSRHGGFAKYNNYLVGDVLSIRPDDLVLLALTLGLLLIYWVFSFNALLLFSVSPSLARSKGIRIRLLEYGFMAVIAILVSVSIRWVGTLLINALLILPAAAARNLARNMKQFHILSLAIAWISGVSGLILSYYLDTAAGASIVLCSAFLFLLTFLARRRKT